MMNDLFVHIFQTDICYYFSTAYALSISGGEEERRKNPNYPPINDLPLLKQLPFSEVDDEMNEPQINVEDEDEMEKDEESDYDIIPDDLENKYSVFSYHKSHQLPSLVFSESENETFCFYLQVLY